MGTALLKKENKKIWEISEIFSVKKNLLKSETKKEIFKMSEEVKEEIEALMSIYEEDMQVLSESPNYVISMHVRSMNDIEDCPTLTLRITYPDDYPNEVLNIEFDEEEEEIDIAEDYLKDLTSCLDNVMEENK